MTNTPISSTTSTTKLNKKTVALVATGAVVGTLAAAVLLFGNNENTQTSNTTSFL